LPLYQYYAYSQVLLVFLFFGKIYQNQFHDLWTSINESAGRIRGGMKAFFWWYLKSHKFGCVLAISAPTDVEFTEKVPQIHSSFS
jgi:hypothetical protein